MQRSEDIIGLSGEKDHIGAAGREPSISAPVNKSKIGTIPKKDSERHQQKVFKIKL
jgi:hypothetical protein